MGTGYPSQYLIFGRQSEILIKSISTRVDALKGCDALGQTLSILYVDSIMERFLQYPQFNFQIRGAFKGSGKPFRTPTGDYLFPTFFEIDKINILRSHKTLFSATGSLTVLLYADSDLFHRIEEGPRCLINPKSFDSMNLILLDKLAQ